MDVQALLTELKNANLSGLNQDQVNALIDTKIKPFADQQAADETKQTQDEATLADAITQLGLVKTDDTDSQTVIKAVIDKLAGITADTGAAVGNGADTAAAAATTDTTSSS